MSISARWVSENAAHLKPFEPCQRVSRKRLTARTHRVEAVLSNQTILIKSVSTIPDECMGVGLEIGTSDVLGNEASENRSGRLSLKNDRRYSQYHR